MLARKKIARLGACGPPSAGARRMTAQHWRVRRRCPIDRLRGLAGRWANGRSIVRASLFVGQTFASKIFTKLRHAQNQWFQGLRIKSTNSSAKRSLRKGAKNTRQLLRILPVKKRLASQLELIKASKKKEKFDTARNGSVSVSHCQSESLYKNEARAEEGHEGTVAARSASRKMHRAREPLAQGRGHRECDPSSLDPRVETPMARDARESSSSTTATKLRGHAGPGPRPKPRPRPGSRSGASARDRVRGRSADMSRISKLAQPRRRITRRSLLELLPVAHVSFHIFSYLDTASLASISAGCRDLYGLASSDIVWRDRVSAGHNAGTMASSLKSQFVQRRRELVARRSAKLKETFRRIQERSGVETCLSRTIERLEVSLTVSINGAVCDLLAFRKRTQQGRKEQFRALGAAPAPNLATGALRFDQAAVLKLAVPPNLSEDQLASLEVTCTTKLKSCGTTRVLAWSKNHGTAPERLGSTGFSQISLGRSAVLFGSLDQAMGPRRGVALLVVSVHHLDVLAALGIAGTMHEPITDDLDRNYGMHGYTGAFTIRSLGQTWWSSSFGDLDSRSSIAGGGEFARFPVLDAEHCEGDVTRRIEFKVPGRGRDGETERPSLYFRTETFSGCLDGYVVVDMTLWDEHREAFWAFTRVLPIQIVDAERSQAFNFNDGVHGNGFEVVHEDQEKGRLRIGIAPMHDRATVVKEMDFALRTRAISSWFGM